MNSDIFLYNKNRDKKKKLFIIFYVKFNLILIFDRSIKLSLSINLRIPIIIFGSHESKR